MRLEFDKSVPRHEQLLRVDAAKTPGRKHQKRKGVKAKQRATNEAKAKLANMVKQAAAYRSKVRAYWRGEEDESPELPPPY
jgi:hypothetical protein